MPCIVHTDIYSINSHIIISSEPSPPRHLCIIGESRDGIELNWIPPLEPNGDVYYLIEYIRTEDNGRNNSTSRTNFYKLTGLQSGVTYNITVVAVNRAGMSDAGAALSYQYNRESKSEFCK